MRHIVTIVGLSLLLALASCGGGGDEDGSGAAERKIDSDAQERAEEIVLKLDDFPEGWRADASDEEHDTHFRHCVGADFSDSAITDEAFSPAFVMGESATVGSDATVFENEAEASSALDVLEEDLRSDDFDSCVRDQIGENAEQEGLEIGEIQVGELRIDPPDVEDVRAWQIAIPVNGTPGSENAGLSVTAYVDFVMLREEEAVAMVYTGDVFTAFDPTLRGDLLDTVADRLRA